MGTCQGRVVINVSLRYLRRNQTSLVFCLVCTGHVTVTTATLGWRNWDLCCSVLCFVPPLGGSIGCSLGLDCWASVCYGGTLTAEYLSSLFWGWEYIWFVSESSKRPTQNYPFSFNLHYALKTITQHWDTGNRSSGKMEELTLRESLKKNRRFFYCKIHLDRLLFVKVSF